MTFINFGARPPIFNQFRVYTVSGSPYADSSTSGSSNIYIGPLPDQGNLATAYDSARGSFDIVSVVETSQQVSTDTASTMYDVYFNFLTRSFSLIAWSTPTTQPTRGTDALGRWCQNGNPSYLFVASFYNVAGTAVYDNQTAGRRHLCNVYNAIEKVVSSVQSSSYATTSTSLTTVGGSTTDGAGRVSYVQAFSKNLVQAQFNYATVVIASASALAFFGLGVNSTSASSAYEQSTGMAYAASAQSQGQPPVYKSQASAGYTYLQQLFASSSGTVTVYSPYLNATVYV
jgi:hypothetical protein